MLYSVTKPVDRLGPCLVLALLPSEGVESTREKVHRYVGCWVGE